MMIDFIAALIVSLIAMVLPILLWSRSGSDTMPLMLGGLTQFAAITFVFGFSAWLLRFRSKGRLLIGRGCCVSPYDASNSSQRPAA